MPAITQRRLPGFRFEAPPAARTDVLPRMDIAVFVGFAASGPLDTPVRLEDEAQFDEIFGADAPLAWDAELAEPIFAYLAPAVRAFFRNGGQRCWVVRTAAAGHVNAFPLDDMFCATLKDDGTFGPDQQVLARARSQGQWSDGLLVGTALQSQPIAVFSVSPDERSALLALRSPDEIVRGDLLRLRFRDSGRIVLFPVETVGESEESGSPPESAVRVTARAAWLQEIFSPPGSPPDAGHSRPGGPLVTAEKLNFEFWNRSDKQNLVRLAGLGFAPGHPRFWNNLPMDEELYASNTLDPSSSKALAWHDWRDIVSPRFPLAGSGGDKTFFFPKMDMAATPARFVGPVETTSRALERDGLAEFGLRLFLDERLEGVGLGDLMDEADFIRYQSQDRNPPPLRGIHAALAVEEATIIAVPDAVHRQWIWQEPKPPELQPSSPPQRPEWWHQLPCDPPPEIPRADHPPRGSFMDCGIEEIAEPALRLDGDQISAVNSTGSYHLQWSPATSDVSFVLETANHADFSDAVEIQSGTKTSAEIFRPPGEYFHRVRAVKGCNASNWSNSVGVRVTTGELWLSAPRDHYANATLLAVHRALLRLSAARADAVAVLALPNHYPAESALNHMTALGPPNRLPTARAATALDGFVPPLTTGEAAALSYGAMYHPWLLEQMPDLDARHVPPDGSACGILARRARERGAWIAPANELWQGPVALDPAIPPESRLAVQQAQINLVRQEPRGFLTLSADTMNPDPDVRPIHVRRLLILLRRLVLKLGVHYVFEPNDDAFRRLVQRNFEALLEDLFRRGASAGATAASSFQVVTGESLNPPQNVDVGRFIVELRVAPAQALTFITVRLMQTGNGGIAVVEEMNMANAALEHVPNYPFTTFNFAVEINVPDLSNQICAAAFAECDGLEMTIEAKTIREGGNNGEVIRMAGPVGYGQLTLKRGMTANFDLWDWFDATVRDPGLRASAEVVVLAADGKSERVRFVLKRCLPVKLKAPALNAKDGLVAVEEFQLAYEAMQLKKPNA